MLSPIKREKRLFLLCRCFIILVAKKEYQTATVRTIACDEIRNPELAGIRILIVTLILNFINGQKICPTKEAKIYGYKLLR